MTRKLIFGSIFVAVVLCGVPADAPEAFASYGNVKSVQSGVIHISEVAATVTDIDRVIQPVDLRKSILFCDGVGVGTNASRQGNVICRFVNSTTIRISTGGNPAATGVAAWQVVEFDSGVSAQRGVLSMKDATASTTITASSTVDLAKAFIILNGSHQDGENIPSSFGNPYIIRAGFTDASTLEFERICVSAVSCGTAPDVDIPWQVVEMDNAVVQSGIAVIDKLDQGTTAALNPAVNINKTFLAYSYWSTQTSGDNSEDTYVPSASTTDGTAISFMIGDSVPSVIRKSIAWFAVEMTDTTNIYYREPTLVDAVTYKDISFPLVNTANSTILLYDGCVEDSNCNGQADVTLAPLFVKGTTTTQTTVRIERANSAADDIKPSIFLIEWPKRTTRLRGKQIRLRGREIRLMQNDVPEQNANVA